MNISKVCCFSYINTDFIKTFGCKTKYLFPATLCHSSAKITNYMMRRGEMFPRRIVTFEQFPVMVIRRGLTYSGHQAFICDSLWFVIINVQNLALVSHLCSPLWACAWGKRSRVRRWGRWGRMPPGSRATRLPPNEGPEGSTRSGLHKDTRNKLL